VQNELNQEESEQDEVDKLDSCAQADDDSLRTASDLCPTRLRV